MSKKDSETNLTTFFVRNGSTIDMEDIFVPATRAEAFDFGDYELRSPETLIECAATIQPVMWALDRLYQQFREELICEAEDVEPVEESDAKLKEIMNEWPEDLEEETAKKWIYHLSKKEFADLCSKMKKWGESEPNWGWEEDYFLVSASGQDAALKYFKDDTDQQDLDTLGVKIVEGEHPGSTYYAAELTVTVDEANNRAISAGIPVRFISDPK